MRADCCPVLYGDGMHTGSCASVTLSLVHPYPTVLQAPGLEELSLGGVLDLRAGPWDALGRLARLRSLKLYHRPGCMCHARPGVYGAFYAGPPPPSPPTGELPPGALPPSTAGEELRRARRLGWLRVLYPHLTPGGKGAAGGRGGGAGRAPGEVQPQQEGCRRSTRVAATLQERQRAGPAEPLAFRLAWLPAGLRTCELDLPWGTRVDRGGGLQGGGASGQDDTQVGAEPPPPGHLARFRVEGAHVVLP
jgi:hypothetical protein